MNDVSLERSAAAVLNFPPTIRACPLQLGSNAWLRRAGANGCSPQSFAAAPTGLLLAKADDAVRLLSTGQTALNLRLLCDLQCVVDLDPKIPDAGLPGRSRAIFCV